MGRLFTKILQTRISKYLEDHDIIEDNQAGFRHNYRTTDQIFTLKTLLNRYNHKLNKPIFVCFVDFSKAFDSVNREALFYKMKQVGITGKMFELIRNMYSSTLYCIKKENYLSKPRVNNIGLKQGDSLSPTLFNIFLNDIGQQLGSSNTYPLQLGSHLLNHLLFADDLLLISETSSGLQHCLEQLSQYCNKWNLKVNINKTKAMIFSKGKKDFKKFKFTFQDLPIDIVEKYKYLGIIFYFNGNLKHAADDLYNKGLKAFFSLRRKFSNFSELPFNISMKLFDALIKPIITYGSEVWISDYKINLSNIDQLPTEKLQHKMLKQVLGVNRYTSNLAVRLECCRSPIILFCISMMYNYFIRIRDMPNNRILHSAFITDQELFKDKSKSWFSNLAMINKLLNIDNEEPIAYNSFVQLLKDYFVNQTECQLNKIRNDVIDSKLMLFSNVLDMQSIPNYLKLFSDRAITREISKFCMSAHYLNIERGRYTKPKTPRNDRICPHCTSVETETHFFTECQRYHTPRNKLFEYFNINSTCSSIMFRLLNPTNRSETLSLYKFIKCALELRNKVESTD